MSRMKFKGMIITHHVDGHFEIVPPSFLWWPAKHAILTVLFTEILFSSVFLFDSFDFSSCLLLGSMSFSLLFAIGYIHERTLSIYIHFITCLLHILAYSIVIPTVYYNKKVCNNAVVCKTIHEWMELIGAPVVSSAVIFYASVSIALHIIMTPISFRLFKYTAAVDGLGRMIGKQDVEKPKNQNRSEVRRIMSSPV